MTEYRWTTCMIVTGALATWLGCSQGADPSELPPAASQGGEATPIEPAELDGQSDEQILGIVTVVDATEIEQAQLARVRAQSPQVREFADLLIRKHGASVDELARIAKTNDMTSEAGSISRALTAQGDQSLDTLRAADEATFDEVYLKLEIDRHREFLSLLNGRLLPDVDNEALLHQLQAARDSAQDQLMHAEKLVTRLK